MNTNITWEYDKTGKKQKIPKDWQMEWGFPENFECPKLQKGDILAATVGKEDDGEVVFNVVIASVNIIIDSNGSCEQWLEVRDYVR